MHLLSQTDTYVLLKKYKISLPRTWFFTRTSELKKISNSLPFPVVLKADSGDVHKSDKGLVRLNIQHKTQLFALHKQIHKRVHARSYLIQEMIQGQETIVGMKRDPQFGPALMFGLGGVFVELLKDVSFRIGPLKEKDADEMMREIKGFPLLTGYRGGDPVNLRALRSLILKISRLAIKHNKIQEIDFNPVIVNKKNAYVVDAKLLQNV